MLSKKNLMVTMVTDEYLENRIIFAKICGHHWIHVVFLIPEMYTFVHFCANLLSNEMHKKSHFLFLGLGWHNLNIIFILVFHFCLLLYSI